MHNIFLVASGKGGVGKSSVTAFLGRALVKLNKKVLLIDMDVSLRSLDLILGVSEKCVYDWGDVLEERASAEQATVKGENGNPDLLCAPVSFFIWIPAVFARFPISSSITFDHPICSI